MGKIFGLDFRRKSTGNWNFARDNMDARVTNMDATVNQKIMDATVKKWQNNQQKVSNRQGADNQLAISMTKIQWQCITDTFFISVVLTGPLVPDFQIKLVFTVVFLHSCDENNFWKMSWNRFFQIIIKLKRIELTDFLVCWRYKKAYKKTKISQFYSIAK